MPFGDPISRINVCRATRRDCDQIFELVNLAFKPEIGKSGIAYRKCDKYRLKDSARKHLEDMWVVKDGRKILGCVRAVAHNGMMEIGPVAVHPEFQGQGYGSKLMDTVENRSNAEKCTVGVVSCREDVIPFFIKRGYKPVVNKSVQEMGKLYPDDLGEKVITRNDIDFLILIKERKDVICDNA